MPPTLLYISRKGVIPAKAGIQIGNTGSRVRPGMTIEVKGILTKYIRNFESKNFLNPQISFLYSLIGLELLIGSFINDLTTVKDAVLIRDSRSKPGVLLYQENGDACLSDFFKYCTDLPDQHRGQSFGGFIEKHELEIHGKDSCDGQHLLFAS
jgi:hypothetical protein